MPPVEQLGSFYLGKEYDLGERRSQDRPVNYDSRDLVTHAICVGMTGSGKTGLCIDLPEEAAIDGVPAIIVDPKGDITNLLLTFPDLRPEEFLPWINQDDAGREQCTPEEYAARVAQTWRDGLAAWDEGPERIRLLKEQIIGWMRTQPGTASLRALFYMDEVFGYFPPVGEPPSKRPLLTLFKQARAFGLGMVLTTQNPVDIDYKALTNAGTWFIGKLQAERDKARLMDGLQRALGDSGTLGDPQVLDRLISSLDSRIFLMHDVNLPAPVVFQTRWAMSYLRGPLTRQQIKALMAPRKGTAAVAPALPAGSVAGQAGRLLAYNPSLKLYARSGESLRDFPLRCQQAACEGRDAAVDRLRDRYAALLRDLEERVRRAEQAGAGAQVRHHGSAGLARLVARLAADLPGCRRPVASGDCARLSGRNRCRPRRLTEPRYPEFGARNRAGRPRGRTKETERKGRLKRRRCSCVVRFVKFVTFAALCSNSLAKRNEIC